MHKKYIELFKELARATAVAAEQVMEYDKEKDDQEAFKHAEQMRDNFEALYNKMNDDYQLTKTDATNLLIGIMVQLSQTQDRIDTLRKAIAGYQTDLIPKLQEIVDKAEDDEAAAKMGNEKFIIENNE